MRITVSYGEKGMDLAGSKEALLELALALKESKGSEYLPLLIPSRSPSAYEGYAKQIRFEHSGELACISREGNEVLMSGSSEKLAALGTNIAWFAEHSEPSSSPRRDHMHVEFYRGHFFLRKESIPLIVTRYDET